MGEAVGVGIAIGTFILGVIGAVATLFFRLGGAERDIAQNTKEIAEIKQSYIKAMDEIRQKIGDLHALISEACERIARVEENTKK